ncbi:PREDICTED: translation initiation factor IF-2-like [Chinchilla lanigera]|uniref:translation initiation factor IF-2-like n=1 Tax=Chinchilla lanigera TaxID=34839 RepID=UPI00038EB812|nr:PREDICTED: translation initiation factor IF-2-like [Chinchilla lanigera]
MGGRRSGFLGRRAALARPLSAPPATPPPAPRSLFAPSLSPPSLPASGPRRPRRCQVAARLRRCRGSSPGPPRPAPPGWREAALRKIKACLVPGCSGALADRQMEMVRTRGSRDPETIAA